MECKFEDKLYAISYIKQGNSKNQTIIIFPEGPGEASAYSELIKELSKKYYILALYLPGHKKTKFESNKMEDMAIDISNFINQLKIKNPILIGESIGGSLAIEIAKIIKINKLVLMGSGEFFTFIERIMLSILFFPSKFSSILRRIYARIISFLFIFFKKSHVLQIDKQTNEQLKEVGDRFNKVIWYKLPIFNSSIKTLLINGNNDVIQRKNSITKIKNIFSNLKIIDVNSDNFGFRFELKKNNFSEITDFLK